MSYERYERISAMLSDDRYDSKDWRQADPAGRIEWLIFMLEAKGEEVENMVRLAEPMLSDALAAADKRIEELEAKLTENEVRLGKAVWRLEQMRDDAFGYRHVSHFRRGATVTLEEFKMLESSHE
jgi:hypothetical protein